MHIVVAAEDVGAAARCAHVAQSQLQDAVSAGVVVAVGVLRPTHTPDHGAGTVVGQRPGHATQLLTGGTGHTLDFFGRPFGNFGLDLIHPPDTGADELFVFPTVLEDVPQNAPNQRHVRTGTEADIFIGMCGCAGEPRVAHDHGGVVLLFRFEQVEKRHRVRLGRVAADDEDGLGVVDVVVRVRHRTIAPGVCNTGHRGGVTDPCLVIHVVRAPIGGELAEQIRLLVIVLGRTQPIHGIRAAFVADLHHAVADLVDRLFPADALPFPVFFLHRVLQTTLTMRVIAHRCALGAVGAQVKRAVPARLLTCPDAVLHFCHDGTADRAVCAHRFNGVYRPSSSRGRAGFCHGAARCTDRCQTTNGQARSAQECAAVYRCLCSL